MNVNQIENNTKTSYAKTYHSNEITIFQPFSWVKKGVVDFFKMPIISLFYGCCFFVAGYTIQWLMKTQVTDFSPHLIVISSLILFSLIGPFLALGLYQASWDLSKNKKASLLHSISAIKRNSVSQWGFAVMLSVFMIFWLRTISLAHIFYPIMNNAPLLDYLTFFIISGGISFFFLAIVFSLSAFSIPLMLERRVDLMTAVFTSLNAVRNNILGMITWSIIISISISIGFLTNGLGLIVLIPIIGYSTWHSYKDTIKSTFD